MPPQPPPVIPRAAGLARRPTTAGSGRRPAQAHAPSAWVQCMCMFPPPPRVAGMRTRANTAKAAAITAAPSAPLLKASAAPPAVVNVAC